MRAETADVDASRAICWRSARPSCLAGRHHSRDSSAPNRRATIRRRSPRARASWQRLRRTRRSRHRHHERRPDARPGGVRRGRAARPAARPLRYGLANRRRSSHRAERRAALRARHLRHEGGPRRSGCRPSRALHGARALPHRVVILWTVDEEVGSRPGRSSSRGAPGQRGPRARAGARQRRREDRPQGRRRIPRGGQRRRGARGDRAGARAPAPCTSSCDRRDHPGARAAHDLGAAR